jgi:hypothetical protein
MVAVASTGKDAETDLTLRIGSSKPVPEVRMTLPDAGLDHASLPDLRPGDRLIASAELEVTTDCPRAQSDCTGNPYRFDPNVEVGLVLADGDRVATPGRRAVRIGRPQRREVTHKRHHDVFVFDNVPYTIPAGGLPWGGPTFVNVAIAAWHRQARRGQVLIIGQNNPGGRPSGNMGAISVVRLRPGRQRQPQPLRTEQRQITALPVITGQPQKGTVYSHRLDDLKTGEQLRVRAVLKTSSTHLGYPVRSTIEVFLSDDPTATRPGSEARRVCPDGPQISRANGKNTLPSDNPMRSEKAGVKRIVKDARAPLYVNVVLTDGDPKHRGQPGDALSIVPGGHLAVTRFSANLAG